MEGIHHRDRIRLVFDLRRQAGGLPRREHRRGAALDHDIEGSVRHVETLRMVGVEPPLSEDLDPTDCDAPARAPSRRFSIGRCTVNCPIHEWRFPGLVADPVGRQENATSGLAAFAVATTHFCEGV